MPTITTNYLITHSTSEHTSRLAESRIGVITDSARKYEIEEEHFGATPIVFSPIETFCFIKAGAPFYLTIKDFSDNESTFYVKNLFLSYINAKEMTVTWDDILQKESAIQIIYK